MNNSYIADDDSRVVIFVDFLYNASRYFNGPKARKLTLGNSKYMYLKMTLQQNPTKTFSNTYSTGQVKVAHRTLK